jgi:hypothetical protein
MSNHKFRVGQIVNFRPRAPFQNAPRGVYEVVMLLPRNEQGEFEYRIKSQYEDHQRVAQESELIAV